MAGLPKRKTSKSRRNSRRAHDKVELPKLMRSKQTGKLVPQGMVTKDHPSHKGIKVIA